jgi:hypothetical protein
VTVIAWVLIGASWTGFAVWVGLGIGRLIARRDEQVPVEPGEPEPPVVLPPADPQVLDLLRASLRERPDTGRPRGGSR